MRAILIDAQNRKIEEVDYNGDYLQIYHLIATKTVLVSNFETVNLPTGADAIYIDGEGLYKNYTWGFLIEGYHSPIVGNGLILGHDEEGNSRPPDISIDQVRRYIRFVGRRS